MAKLIFSAITSLDGYIEDENGKFDWAEPDEEVLAFVNQLERPIGTYLYGRRMYQTMLPWETMDTAGQSPATQDFAALWRAADKVVYSHTLSEAPTERTQLERDFDPGAAREMKASARRDLTVGGPELATHAFAAGLVDECQLFLVPIVVGGGKKALPEGMRVPLVLLDERRFRSGVVYLHYRTQGAP